MTVQAPQEFSGRLRELLAECGIALVYLPHLKGSFLQGASFSDGKKIVVGLTARGKDADKFWFSLFHELGHILMGHIDLPDGTTEKEETDADKWSQNELIPTERFEEFKQANSFTEYSIINFAKSIDIAPGIVVGRLQNEKIIGHNMMNGLKEHYIIAV